MFLETLEQGRARVAINTEVTLSGPRRDSFPDVNRALKFIVSDFMRQKRICGEIA